MIVVTASAAQVTVTGHARCAPLGQDIVCAAVSALTACLAHALQDLTPDGQAQCSLKNGDADIKIAHPTNETKLLIKAYTLGIMDIAESYQGSVKLVEALTTVKQGNVQSNE